MSRRDSWSSAKRYDTNSLWLLVNACAHPATGKEMTTITVVKMNELTKSANISMGRRMIITATVMTTMKKIFPMTKISSTPTKKKRG